MARSNVTDMSMLGVAVLIPPLPFVIFFSSLYFKFDPYYFVLGDLIGDASYQNTTVTMFTVCLICRGFLTLCAFECARTITLIIMLLLLVLDNLQCQSQNIVERIYCNYFVLKTLFLHT